MEQSSATQDRHYRCARKAVVLWMHPKDMVRGGHMADRKQFDNIRQPNPELTRLLDEARRKPVSEEELQEQRISFAFGNAPFNSEGITKDSVRLASKRISILC